MRGENVFHIIDPEEMILAFTTKGGHVSGNLMKGIEFREPDVIKELKHRTKLKTKIGDVIRIRNYYFVIYKKHYNSKITSADFEHVLKLAKEKIDNNDKLKTTIEDIEKFKDVLVDYFPNIRICKRSDWGS
ncbi:MAG: hypothetical protein ACOCUD_04260 [Bacillota bacterium]